MKALIAMKAIQITRTGGPEVLACWESSSSSPERRHDLLREAAQRLDPTRAVEQDVFGTEVAQRLELDGDLVRRAVERARFGGLERIRVGHDGRLVLSVRTLREVVDASPRRHACLERLLTLGGRHRHVDRARDRDAHRVEATTTRLHLRLEEGDPLADLLDRRELVQEQTVAEIRDLLDRRRPP